jgi:cytoskeletal protein CcmA (bactofilin family)
MSQTVIGPGTRVSGPLMGKDDLIVEGQVDGPVHGEAAVTIKLGARVGGEVRGRDVTIAGELSHPVYATSIVRLAATAKLTGDIEAPRISIDEGAVFEGQVRMRKPSAAPAIAAAPPSAAPAAEPAKIVQTHNKPPEIVQAHNNLAREIPELAVPGRKRLIRKTS